MHPNEPLPWIIFCSVVSVLLTLDLTVFHKHNRESTLKESFGWTVFWFSLALGFNIFLWRWLGSKAALEFAAAYLTEWAMSMDNVFVFAVIFGFFRVPKKYQYRVLFWGILGAVVMRLSFILLGAELVQRFTWTMPLLGLFLIYTAWKLVAHGDAEVHPDQNPVLRWARKILPVSQSLHNADVEAPPGQRDTGADFFIRQGGKLYVTPLFLVLLVIESTDVVFAVDSVPATLSLVSADEEHFQFVAFTSNVCAILGLRALYFLLAGMMDAFRYLKYGLSAILAFVGVKMILSYLHHEPWSEKYVPHTISEALERPYISLGIIIALLGISIIASLLAEKRDAKKEGVK